VCFFTVFWRRIWRCNGVYPTGFDGVVMVGEGAEEVLWWWVFSCWCGGLEIWVLEVIVVVVDVACDWFSLIQILWPFSKSVEICSTLFEFLLVFKSVEICRSLFLVDLYHVGVDCFDSSLRFSFYRFGDGGWVVAINEVFPSVKSASCFLFRILCRRSCNDSANVNYLLIPETFGGLHRAGCFGGLVCWDLCGVCFCRIVAWKSWVLARVFSVGDLFMWFYFSFHCFFLD
jgi:hypothetical protein